jgi:hypothetical protein
MVVATGIEGSARRGKGCVGGVRAAVALEAAAGDSRPESTARMEEGVELTPLRSASCCKLRSPRVIMSSSSRSFRIREKVSVLEEIPFRLAL